MVKATTFLAAVLLLVAPALGNTFADEPFAARDLAGAEIKLFERDPLVGRILLEARETGLNSADLSAREVDAFIEDLSAREPFIGGLFRAGKRILGFRRSDGTGLDFADVEARSPIIGGLFRAGKRILGFRREELEALEARDVLAGKMIAGVKRALEDSESLEMREPEPFIGGLFRAGKKILGFRRGDIEDMEAREWADLDELD